MDDLASLSAFLYLVRVMAKVSTHPTFMLADRKQHFARDKDHESFRIFIGKAIDGFSCSCIWCVDGGIGLLIIILPGIIGQVVKKAKTFLER